MLDAVVLLGFCLLVGLISLLVFLWIVFTRNLFTIDNICLVLIDLTIGAIFMANVAWSWHTGEFREVLNYFLKGRRSKGESGPPAGGA